MSTDHPQLPGSQGLPGTYVPNTANTLTANVPPSPPNKPLRPFKPCNANLLRQAIRAHYQPVVDWQGVFYLVPHQPGYALLMEPELIASELKRLAADVVNRDVSDQQVKDALEILRTEPTPQYVIGNGRTWIGAQHKERYLLLDGNMLMWPAESENLIVAQYPSACWQPANCCAYVTQQAQGPSAWRCENIHKLSDTLAMPADRELLIFTFMILSVMPERSQLALELTGESKSGKTLLVHTLKWLIDPCTSDELIRQIPDKLKDLTALAWHHHVVALDNVETPLTEVIQRRMFDFLKGTRVDWRPNRREPWPSHITARRTFMVTSPETVVTQRELCERTLSLEMTPADTHDDAALPTAHLPHTDTLFSPYEGGLVITGFLALLGKAHAQIDRILLDRRVSEGWEDFCRIGVIISQALYGTNERFWAQYEAYCHERQREVIEADPVAYAIEQYFQTNETFGVIEKAAGVWLNDLTPYRPAWVKDRDWPQAPRGLGAAFKRAAPLLKAHGFICHSNGKRGSQCRWSIGPASVAARHY